MFQQQPGKYFARRENISASLSFNSLFGKSGDLPGLISLLARPLDPLDITTDFEEPLPLSAEL